MRDRFDEVTRELLRGALRWFGEVGAERCVRWVLSFLGAAPPLARVDAGSAPRLALGDSEVIWVKDVSTSAFQTIARGRRAGSLSPRRDRSALSCLRATVVSQEVLVAWSDLKRLRPIVSSAT